MKTPNHITINLLLILTSRIYQIEAIDWYTCSHAFTQAYFRNHVVKDGGDSLMLQRLLGHTTLIMSNTYCQAV